MQAGIGQNRLIVTNWSSRSRYNRIKPENQTWPAQLDARNPGEDMQGEAC
jgi:hypothetical protein